MTLQAGTRLGPYEIVSPLGRGGMGEVYRARDKKLEREVAVKVLPADLLADADALARFEREAKAIAALSHPNILAIHDFGTDGGITYVATELLEGETLRDMIGSGPIPLREVLDYATQILKGLAAAHAKGIVHRDLKPSNLFVSRDGHVKILDFGLAKKVGAPEPATLTPPPLAPGRTDPGAIVGTVEYMSPEQAKGVPVDHRSDIFSFGTILYELLSGANPFRRNTFVETTAAILRDEPPPLSGPGRNVSPSLDSVVRHCLEKERERRFQTAKDIAFSLSERSSPTVTPEPPEADSPAVRSPGAPRQPPQSSRRFWPLWFALGAFLVLLVFVYFLAHRSGHFVVKTINYVVGNITPTGWSPDLVRFFVIVATIPFFWAVAKYTSNLHKFWKVRPSIKLYRDPHGILIIVYVAAFFLAKHLASSERWCARTPEGMKAFAGPGIDPVFHIALHPCTTEDLIELKELTHPRQPFGPNEIIVRSLEEWNRLEPYGHATTRAKVYFCKDASGGYRLFDGEGVCPWDGKPLMPLDVGSRQQVDRWIAERFRQAAEHEREVTVSSEREATKTAQRNQEIADAASREATKTAQRNQEIASSASREATKTAEEAFIRTYVDSTVQRRPGARQWAVVATDAQGRPVSELVNAARDTLSSHGIGVVSLFRPSFVSNGLQEHVFRGDTQILARLRIAERCEGVVLAKVVLDYSKNPELEGLTTASSSAEVRVISADPVRVLADIRVDSKGAGFSAAAAQAQALERLSEAFKSRLAQAIR